MGGGNMGGGNMGGNMGGENFNSNMGGGNFGGRSRPYNNGGWGGRWGGYGPWYSGWWGGNNWSGEFSDRMGVAAPTTSRRSASSSAAGVRPRRPSPAGLGNSRL